MKLITFTVPCYNSSEYMEKCIQSLLHAGNDAEIILVNDGSYDDTGLICDKYAAEYPDIIKVIHQQNSGHGEGINQGLRCAQGLYYKVFDSDDWADISALQKLMAKLRDFSIIGDLPDIIICNYIYDQISNGKIIPMRYVNVFPQSSLFYWKDIKRFRLSQYLLMHSVIFKTSLLHEQRIELPKHTFYVDNLFAYTPLPYVRTLFYLNADLYHYCIGRVNQSVNEKVMTARVDQQIRITKLMIDSHDIRLIKRKEPKLAGYMINYMSIMMMISSILLILDNVTENKQKQSELWGYLKKVNPYLYTRLRYTSLSGITAKPCFFGRKIIIFLYRLANKRYGFN